MIKLLKITILIIITQFSLFSATSMKKSTIVEKKDFGPIIYAEDYYRLYSLPMYFTESELLKNIEFLQMALDAPFDFANRALTIIETEEAYQRYKDLMHMQFNYLITQNYIYIASMYDKQHYYFYNSQFKDDIKKSFEYAVFFYNLAMERWTTTKEFAAKAVKNKAKLNMDSMIDKAYKINLGEIDYDKTAKRRIKSINEMLEQMN